MANLPPEDARLPPGTPVDFEKKYDNDSPSDESPPPPPPASQASPPPPPGSSPSPSPGTPNNNKTSPSPPPPPPPPASSPPPPPAKSSPSPSSSPSPPPPASKSSPPPSGNNNSTTPSPPAPANNASPPPPGALPPPGVPEKATPPSRGIPSADSASSGSSNNSPPSSDSSSSSNNTALIAGVAVAGAVVIAFLFVWLLCSKKKKKQPYYMDPGRPPKDGYYNGSTHWNNQNPGEHVVKVPPPPGAMGGPGGGSWAAPPPPPQANMSNEFNSGFIGHNHAGIPPPSPAGLGGFNKSQFSYEELAGATGGFSQPNLLGQGGFGYVHKGVLSDGREVAVKSLKSGSGQGEREFQAEVEIISRVHHRHLVSLVGYCIADGQRMLVYEFVPNKTLEFHLHGKGQPVMDWAARLRIAMGSAKGLAYLHEDCYPKIIHRDIKAANILLDDNFEAMVADFGLAKLSSDNYTHVSTRVMGTFGYLAPEYASSGKLTEKSDVFSFGVMLLELIAGKRPVDPANKFMEDSLVDWARPLLTKALEDGNYNEIVDPRLEGNYVAHELARMIACASASIRHSARRRPKMSQIVRALEGDSSLEDLNEGAKQNQNGPLGSQSSSTESLTYDTGMYNADMSKFRKMVMNSHDYNSSEFGATSDYGLNPSSSSSDSREFAESNQKPKL
ncbi:hypothetical protein ACH5RR_013771 [Cinchona calisaya]|uniref:non-specific serine/threonine protein kinase n=1 Tax=Cinchona calisaya TaxID=153742 RepID=A0ABD3A130_9GENT